MSGFAIFLRSALLSSALLAGAPVQADEIADTIQEALDAYQGGDLTGAKQSLDYASQLIAQKNAAGLSTILPSARPGWEAEDGDADATAGLAMFGGGIAASRTYRKDGNDVELTIVGDSPMIAHMLPMLANPQLIGMSGGKMLRVGKMRAMQTADGEINMVVANRFLVTVKGSAPAEDKLAYIEAVDTARLEGF